MSQRSISPANVAMLVQGNEVYGIGTIERQYAELWPDMTFVCMGGGALHDWLCNRRAKVELIEGLTSIREKNTFVTLARMPLVLHWAKRDARRIDERLAGRGIRAVHAHWRPQQIIAGFLRRRGYRSVWQINNNTSRARLGGVGIKLNHRLAKWGADLLLPASDYIAANWQGCGVAIQTIRNSAVPLFDAPNELSQQGPVRALVAGRLEASKGHHVAVEAIIRARQAGCDVTLDIFGGPIDGNSYADDLRRMISAAKTESSVRFMGFCDDLRQRHQEYHLGLQCRIDPEPCSLWVCETMVDGLPLIASATGGTPELVDDGMTGLLYSAGSVHELTKRILELAGDRPRLAAMRVAAFDRGQGHFTVERFLKETLSAYQSLDD